MAELRFNIAWKGGRLVGFLLPCLCLPSQAVELRNRRKDLGADMKGPIPPRACWGLGEEQTCDTALLQNVFIGIK